MTAPATEFVELSAVRLVEPPVVAIGNGDDLTVWRADGCVVLRIGPASEIGADTISIPDHLVLCVARTLAEAEAVR